jgi:hypothetical protein
MTTRAKDGLFFPALYNSMALSPVPRTFLSALADPNWRAAMQEEYTALLQNNTWDLVPRPSKGNIVSGKWIFRHKFAHLSVTSPAGSFVISLDAPELILMKLSVLSSSLQP